MKKLNKKGFTIVELVIVIAVIAILAGVLIPTFATVVDKANKSAAMQQAKNAYENYLVEAAEKGTDNINLCIKVEGSKTYYFYVNGGQFDATAHDSCTTSTATDLKHVVVAKGAETFSIDSNDNLVTTHTN